MHAFQPAMEEYVERLQAYYGPRLLSIYLAGSVAREEAVPGLSDLNLICVFGEAGKDPEAEEAWYWETTRAMEARYPDLARPDPDAVFTFTPLLLEDACPQEPPPDPRDEVLELQWGGRLLWGEEVRDWMPSCPVPRLRSAREWAARAARAVNAPGGSLLAQRCSGQEQLRLAGHRVAKAALTCCLAVGVAEGQGFTLLSRSIVERFAERHPDWAEWAPEFARSFQEPPATPEEFDALLEATRVLVDWTATILYAIGRPHNMRL